jgi:hypothetical protein
LVDGLWVRDRKGENMNDNVAVLDPAHEGSTVVIIDPEGKVQGFQIGGSREWKEYPDFVDEDDFPFFMTSVVYTIDCISAWAKHKAANEKDLAKKGLWSTLGYTMENSNLLSRLIEGKPAFVQVPPRSYNSNWYELLDNGEDIVREVEFTRFRSGTGFAAPLNDAEYVNLNKGSWDIIEELDDREYLVTYGEDNPEYLLRKATKEEQERLLSPYNERSEDINAWIIIREEEDDGGNTGT